MRLRMKKAAMMAGVSIATLNKKRRPEGRRFPVCIGADYLIAASYISATYSQLTRWSTKALR